MSETVEPIAAKARRAAAGVDDVEAAAAQLRVAAQTLGGLAGAALIEAVAAIDEIYGRFPELEARLPRAALAAELRASLDPPLPAFLPLLMVCAALDPAPASPSVTALLEAMARTDDGGALAQAVAILGRRRRFGCEEIAVVLKELCRQGRLQAALALVVAALPYIDAAPEAAAADLGAALASVLGSGGADAADPSGLARLILSARHRLQSVPRPPPGAPPGGELLVLVDRVADKLPPRHLPAPPTAATGAQWRTGRFDFAEFAAQWPEICAIGDEWLAFMKVGRAGERRDAGICAKPGQSGHLLFGPYARLGAGDYRVRVRWQAGPPLRTLPHGQPVATIETVSHNGKAYLAQRQLPVEECLGPEHQLLFRIADGPAASAPIEVRVWTSGAVPLTVSSITVERVAAATPHSLGN